MAKASHQLIILEYNSTQYNLVLSNAKNGKIICENGRFTVFDSLDELEQYQAKHNITICINNCPYYNINSFDVLPISSVDEQTCSNLLDMFELASVCAQSLSLSFAGDDDDMCDEVYDALYFGCEAGEAVKLEKDEITCLQKILKQGKQIILKGLGL